MELIGHQKIYNALTHAGAANFPQTLLLTGQRGVGKRTLASALAAWLTGQITTPGTDKIGNNSRIVRLGTTAHQISVDAIREMAPLFYVRHTEPLVIIVEHAELFNGESGNALLKIMEEPIANLYFIVVAQSPDGILPTIRSRAAIIRLSPVSETELRVGLQKFISENNLTVDEIQLTDAINFAEGRPGVALRYLTDEEWRGRVCAERLRFETVLSARTIREGHEAIAELVGKKEDHTTARAELVEILEWWLLWLKQKFPNHAALAIITETIGELSENMHPRLLLERVVIALKA